MSVTFDTVQAAMVTKIKTAAVGFKTVKSFQGDWERSRKQLIALLPACLVVLKTSNFSKKTMSRNPLYDQTAVFTIMIASKALRSEAKGRKGTGSTKGSYEMINAVKDILIEEDLDLNIMPIQPGEIKAAFVLKSISLYHFEFKTSWITKRPVVSAAVDLELLVTTIKEQVQDLPYIELETDLT